MKIRRRYKIYPNTTQSALMAAWLVTLRKNRNFALRQRIDGYQGNNQDADSSVSYSYGSYCNVETKAEYGACCPLTCPVVKHGVLLSEVERMTKTSKGQIKWDSASGIQMKRNTELRKASPKFAQINSDVLQRNIAKLDASFPGFWSHGRGFPAFKKAWQFNSFEYKPKQVKITSHGKGDGKTHNGSVYLPGIGAVKCRDSWDLPEGTETRTVTVIREGGDWFISALIEVEGELPVPKPVEEIRGVVGLDVGINKLVSYSDGSLDLLHESQPIHERAPDYTRMKSESRTPPQADGVWQESLLLELRSSLQICCFRRKQRGIRPKRD